jgi:formate dehydrogenase major subunit
MKSIESVCTYCGVGCDIIADVEDNEILKVYADKDGAVSQGRLCVKGIHGHDFLYSPNRIHKPRIRRSFIEKNQDAFPEHIKNNLFLLRGYDQTWLESTTELAYDIVAWKLTAIRDEFSGEAFGAIGGARSNCESGFLFQQFARETMDSPNVDNCGRVCHAPSLKGMRVSIGEGAASNPFNDIYETDNMIIIGSNTTEGHPITADRIMHMTKRGTPLSVIDVRRVSIGKSATEELVIPYEANLLVLNMIAYVILSENLQNDEFIKTRCKNFDTYKEGILNDPYSNPDFLLSVDGYEELPDQIRTVARRYATKKSMIFWGLGITEHIDGSKAVSAICDLALMTGNIGKSGAGLMPLRGQNNVQGVCDMGMLPYYDPDYQVPKKVGKMTPDMVDAILDGEIKSLWNISEDLAHIHPNLHKVHKALDKLDFFVVNDLFPNESTEFADIIFGVKSAYEKEGVYVNAERRLHFSQPLIDCDLPDDWEVLNEVSKRMNAPYTYTTQEDVWNAVRIKAPNRFSGASYEKLRANRRDGMQWPIAEDNLGTPVLHTEDFRTKDGIGAFILNHWERRGQIADILDKKSRNYYLSTGRIIEHYNNARQTGECTKLEQRHEEDVILVSKVDAADFNKTKRYIMKTVHGETRPLKIRITKNLKQGTLFTTFHHSNSHINFIFGDESDCYVKTARFKSVKVEIIEAS